MTATLVRAGRFLQQYVSFWHLKRILIFLGVDVVLMAFVRKGESDAVLLLRFDLLGDYILGRNFLRLVRKYPAYHAKRIILCANISLKELIETYDSDVFDDFIWIDRTRLLNEVWYRFKILKQLKRIGAQVAIHPTYGREPYMGDCLMWATRAKERVGREGYQKPTHVPTELNRAHPLAGDRFYTRLLREDHQVTFDFYRNKSFFSSVLPGVAVPENTRLTPIPVPVPEIKGPFAVLFPGASEAFREWPPERFAQIANHLFATRGIRSVIMGPKGDHRKAVIIQEGVAEGAVDNLCGRLTLAQVVYLASQSVIGITNDSGGIHLLAALNKPGIGISNAYSLGLFHPYPKGISESVSFVYPPAFYALSLAWFERKEIYGRGKHFSIADVLPEAVIERIERVLQGKPINDLIQAMCEG